MKQLLKLYLSFLTVHLPSAQIKTCFLVLWFNCELKIETGNKKCKTKHLTDSRLLTELSKTKYHVFSFSKEGKELMLKTLEVYNVKNTRGVHLLKFTRGDMLIIRNLHPLDTTLI